MTIFDGKLHPATFHDMLRQPYFNFIEEKLNFLAYRIQSRAKLNLLDLNLHAEDFYEKFLNLLFSWKLANLNKINPNSEGVDLVDKSSELVCQVSSTAAKAKVESALAKDLSMYTGFRFKFIAIAQNAADLRKKTFRNPHKLVFDPQTDIYDTTSLLACVKGLDISDQHAICEFLKAELRSDPQFFGVESHLTSVIRSLSMADWKSEVSTAIKTVPYDIPCKINHNDLDVTAHLISDHVIHYHRLDLIYSEFDKDGGNRSISVLNGLRDIYLRSLSLEPAMSADERFTFVVDRAVEKVKSNSDFLIIAEDELLLCVQIIVVDAFVRCKIFKNPSESY